VRRGAPDVQDPGLNSHSKINCITACIQVGLGGRAGQRAAVRGAGSALGGARPPTQPRPAPVPPPPPPQATKAGADEGLMLDPQGFVSTCNSTNFAIVRRGEVRV
jgi:hypothetical protein